MDNIIFFNDDSLVITYTYGPDDQGICGHTYECIEYFWLLKDHFNVKIFLAEEHVYNNFKNIIQEKYNFSGDEISFILSKTYFKNKPKIIKSKYILITDGAYSKIKLTNYLADKIFVFMCGDLSILNEKLKKYVILMDKRLYDVPKHIKWYDYTKKMLFSRFRKIDKFKNNTLIYITDHCRSLQNEEKYKNYNNLIALSENKYKYIKTIKPPLNNFHSEFDTFIYTSVPRKFDCSPRLVLECYHYNKKVIFDLNYNISEDKGLFYRLQDYTANKVNMIDNDEIISIIQKEIQ